MSSIVPFPGGSKPPSGQYLVFLKDGNVKFVSYDNPSNTITLGTGDREYEGSFNTRDNIVAYLQLT